MHNRQMKRIIALLFLLSWIALLFTFSSQSYEKQSILPFLHKTISEQTAEKVLPNVDFEYHYQKYSSKKHPFDLIEFLFRKAAHLFMYAVLAVGFAIVIGLDRSAMKAWPLPLLLVWGIAALDEWNQRYSIGRTSNPRDIWIDVVGATMGLLFYLLGRSLYSMYKSRTSLIK